MADTVKYFQASDNKGDEKIVERKISPNLIEILKGFGNDALTQIAAGQKKDVVFSNQDYDKIFQSTKNFLTGYGIKIARIDFKKK